MPSGSGQKIHLNPDTGDMALGDAVFLGPATRKNQLPENARLTWEKWPPFVNGLTVTHRAIINPGDPIYGPLYLIVTFAGYADDAPLDTWSLAPRMLIEGEPNKPQGRVTQKLQAWFNQAAAVTLPVSGTWGEIDAAYDPHNRTGKILCRYRLSQTP
jgi:hypothetical protein